MIAIISDIHANIEALEAVLKEIEGVDEIWSLGDLVGYGPNPNEVIGLIKDKLSVSLAGNHDQGAIGKINIADFTSNAEQALKFTEKALSAENRDYLNTLSTREVKNGFTLAHAAPGENKWEYILSPESAYVNFEKFETPWCLVGHTHMPAVYSDKPPHIIVPKEEQKIKLSPDDKLIINPGSVGQPRDGLLKSSFVLFDATKKELVFKRTDYDVKTTQKSMKKEKLPQTLIKRLSGGL